MAVSVCWDGRNRALVRANWFFLRIIFPTSTFCCHQDILFPGEILYGKLNSQGLDSPFPGKIQSLEKIGDDFLISYLPSPDSGEQESWLKASRGEGTSESVQRIKEKMKTKTVLFRKNTKQLEPIGLPPMYYNSFRVIGENIWWMKPVSFTVEEESFTVIKGRLEEGDK